MGGLRYSSVPVGKVCALALSKENFDTSNRSGLIRFITALKGSRMTDFLLDQDASVGEDTYRIGDEVITVNYEDEDDIDFDSLPPEVQEEIDAMLGGDLEVDETTTPLNELVEFYERQLIGPSHNDN